MGGLGGGEAAPPRKEGRKEGNASNPKASNGTSFVRLIPVFISIFVDFLSSCMILLFYMQIDTESLRIIPK